MKPTPARPIEGRPGQPLTDDTVHLIHDLVAEADRFDRMTDAESRAHRNAACASLRVTPTPPPEKPVARLSRVPAHMFEDLAPADPPLPHPARRRGFLARLLGRG